MGVCETIFSLRYGGNRYTFKAAGELLRRYEIAEDLFWWIKGNTPAENTIFGGFSEVVLSSGFTSELASGNDLVLFTMRPEDRRREPENLFIKYLGLLSTYSDSEGINFIGLISDIFNFVRTSENVESMKTRSMWASDLISSHIIPTYLHGFKRLVRYVLPLSEYKGDDLVRVGHGIFVKPPLMDSVTDTYIIGGEEYGVPSGSPPLVFYLDYSSFDSGYLFEMVGKGIPYEHFTKAIAHLTIRGHRNPAGFYIMSEDFIDIWDIYKDQDFSDSRTIDRMIRAGDHLYPVFYDRGRTVDEKVLNVAYVSDILRQNYESSNIKVYDPAEEQHISEIEIQDADKSLYDYTYHYKLFVSYRKNIVRDVVRELSASGDPVIEELMRDLEKEDLNIENLIENPLFNVLDGFETMYAYMLAESMDEHTYIQDVDKHKDAIEYVRDNIRSPLFNKVDSTIKMKVLNTLMLSEDILKYAEDRKSSDMLAKGDIAERSVFIKNIISKC